MAGSGDVSVRLKALEELCGELTTKNRALEEQCAEHRARLETLEGAFAGQNTKKNEEEVKQPAGSANKVTPEDSGVGAAELGVCVSEQPLLGSGQSAEEASTSDPKKDYAMALPESIYSDFVLTWARGTRGQILTSTFVCLVCLAVQFSFSACVSEISEGHFDAQYESMSRWQDNFLDENGWSATRKVSGYNLTQYCSGEAWAWEADALQDLQKYSRPVPWLDDLPQGFLFKILAVMLWAGYCTAEMREAIDFFGLLSLTSADGVKSYTFDEGTGTGTLMNLGRPAKFAVSLIGACRIGIMCMLGCYGCRFLSTTANLMDLILNGVALTFIVDIDDLCFRFLSANKQEALRTLNPPELTGHTVRAFLAHHAEVASTFSIFFITLFALHGSFQDDAMIRDASQPCAMLISPEVAAELAEYLGAVAAK